MLRVGLPLMNALATLHELFAPVPWIKEFRVVKRPIHDSRSIVSPTEIVPLDDLRALLKRRCAQPCRAGRAADRSGAVADRSWTGVLLREAAFRQSAGAAVLPGLSELPRTLPDTLRRAAQNGQAGTIVHLAARRWRKTPVVRRPARGSRGGVRRSIAVRIESGDSAILLLDGSAEVLPAFWGCLLAGITAGDCADSADVHRREPRTGTALSRVEACSTGRSSLPTPN